MDHLILFQLAVIENNKDPLSIMLFKAYFEYSMWKYASSFVLLNH